MDACGRPVAKHLPLTSYSQTLFYIEQGCIEFASFHCRKDRSGVCAF